MGLFGTIGSVGGMVLGNMVAPGVGGAVGGALGGMLGNALEPETGMPQTGVTPGILQNQNALIANLQNQINGVGPNPAIQQMRKANDENIRQNAGFVASQKGINPALAARLAAQNQAMISQKNAADMGITQANQQIQAQQTLAGVLNGQAGVDTNRQQLEFQNRQANNNRNTNIFGGLLNGAGAYVGQQYTANQNQTQQPQPQPQAQKPQTYDYANQSRIGMSNGGPVPGQAPIPNQNNPANDIVNAKLSPGEIVIPITHSKSPEMAKRFIDQVLKNKKTHAKAKSIDEIDVAQVMKVNTELKKRVAQLEKKAGK